MNAVVSDFDGILVATERAKALGWYAAAKRIRGELADRDLADIRALNPRGRALTEDISAELRSRKNAVLPNNPEDRRRLVGDKLPQFDLARMVELHGRSDLDLAVWCAGGTTENFRNNIWDVFLANGRAFRNLSPAQRDDKLRELEETRATLKRPFMILGAEPLAGNHRFFGVVLDALGAGHLALVNQSNSADMKDLFGEHRLWLAETRLPSAFGNYIAGQGFPLAICVGDKHPGVPDKEAAYRRACSAVDVNPIETMTFEDTTSGVKAAVSAGIGITVGSRAPDSMQDLSGSDYIVDGTLERIARIAEDLPVKSVEQVRKEFDDLCRRGIIAKTTG